MMYNVDTLIVKFVSYLVCFLSFTLNRFGIDFILKFIHITQL